MDEKLRKLELAARVDSKNRVAQETLSRAARRYGHETLFPRSWDEDSFWELETGAWEKCGNSVNCQGTRDYREHFFIQSAEEFGEIDMTVSLKYQTKRPSLDPHWAFARGFALVYHQDSENSIEFRFFPDAQQYSLYLHDANNEAEVIRMGPPLPPKKEAQFQFIVRKGQIEGVVNSEKIFSEKTNLRRGHLRLTTHNNPCHFKLEQFSANAPELDIEAEEVGLPKSRRYGRVTLSQFHLKGDAEQGQEISARPGEELQISTDFLYEGPEDGTTNQIILGIPKLGALVCLYNGFSQGQGQIQSSIIAPDKPGTYELRFRYAQARNAKEALDWWGVDGEPTARATIARLHVQ